MFDILILAALTAFLFYKLYSVLGDTSYSEISPQKREALRKKIEALRTDAQDEFPEDKPDPVEIDVKSALEAELSTDLQAACDSIRNHDPKFTLDTFVNKSKLAYEYILTQVAENNIKALESLVAEELLISFKNAAQSYMDNEQTLNFAIIGFNKLEVQNISANDHEALITLAINAEIINYVTNNSDGSIAAGTKKAKARVETWTFSRDFKHRSNVWKLISIERK